MRNSLPLLSRAGSSSADTPAHSVPAIRLLSATPSVMGSNASQDISTIAPFAYTSPASHVPSPLAPRANPSPHKRIVPKKSKLGLLVSKPKLSTANTGKPGDFSDVVRRVGSSPSKGGFEIYVDHQDDPDLGEIVVVKKKKSRKGLNGMRWGALGEVTNVPAAQKDKKPQESLLKIPKGDENQTSKWWSIGKGTLTLGSKEKSQDKTRSKTPETLRSVETEGRTRFNSLDSGILLNDPPSRPSVGTYSSSATLLSVPEPGFLSVPPADGTSDKTGSIAVRAMRSMRSLARMKSWANINGDKDKEGNAPTSATNTITNVTITKATTAKTKEKEGKKKKEKKDKKDKSKAKQKSKTIGRYSGSSFEAGALSPQSSPIVVRTQTDNDGAKKSKLSLGIPSTLRLSAIRNLSSTSLVSHSRAPTPVPAATITTTNTNVSNMGTRLSVDSAHLMNGRPSSTITAGSSTSSGSSLRPASTISAVSTFEYRVARSSSSSVVSVRWDEECLRDSKEIQKRERSEAKAHRKTDGRESRRSAEGRRRTPISEVFPEIQSTSRQGSPTLAYVHPIVTVEEATADGHEAPSDSSAMQTPVKNVRPRPRPMSEQLLGKIRPRGISDEADVMLSVSDAAAATNDLANLINWLDLEATPASNASSPLRPSPLKRTPSTASLGRAGDGSPSKLRGMRYTFNKDTDTPILNSRDSAASFASLRTYALAKAQCQAQTQEQANKAVLPLPSRQQPTDPVQARMLIGQQIVPWSSLDWQVSPKKAPSRPANGSSFRPTHKRTPTPAPAADPPIVFQPLRPAVKERLSSVVSEASSTPQAQVKQSFYPSSQTFGSSTKPAKIGVDAFDDLDCDGQSPPSPSPSAAFKKGHRHTRATSKASILSALCDSGTALPIEAMKSLGLTGTLGGPDPEVDPEDPDSDIPEELQDLLAGQSDEELTQVYDDPISARRRSSPPSPGLPPAVPLPEVFCIDDGEELPVLRVTLLDENDNEADIEDSIPASPSENDTSKSFDFTGELKRLHESGASDRHSFVEQLENAFRTPARVDLNFHLQDSSFLRPDVPPVPPLPLEHRSTPGEDIVPQNVSACDISISIEAHEESSLRDSAASDTLDHLFAECEDFCRPYGSIGQSPESMRSKESDGKLNTSFKFGGKASMSDLSAEEFKMKPLTLSDIIPPLAKATEATSQGSSFVEEDSSVLKSIYAQAYEDDTSVFNSVMQQATDVPPVPRPRLDSDSSSKRRARHISAEFTHSRNVSEASFTGFDSFDEIRRGFEFGPNRPNFYPPPGAPSIPSHGRHASLYSIASESSYGAVIRSGCLDPFGYGPSRPVSTDEMSLAMSLTVDDTFSFLKRDPHRKRVDSDASSFYFRGVNTSRRSHRRNESSFSITSNAPPVSLYTRNFGGHRRNDSNGSISSVAQSYATHGASGGRVAWARHRQDRSMDSTFSDFSIVRLGRPGVGDKMFDSDYGMPLTAISGSPAGSTFSEQEDSESGQPTSYDSILGTEDPRSSVIDSLFEQTGYKTTYSNVDVFDVSEVEQGRCLQRSQFRPVSILSISSEHTMAKEDDTMISMLGGGHVRRRSVDSWVERSPCQGRKPTSLQVQHPGRALSFEQSDRDVSHPEPNSASKISPDKVILSKPSIASTSSYQFGGERMIMARRGLLERQSLEDSALMAQGEELLASLNSSKVFARPTRTNRSRSSTVTSGAETPPLSLSDGSSASGGSQSSIDLGQLNNLLTASIPPSSGISRARTARVRARGTGHRRRISQARASRSSVYETIQEESFILSNTPSPEKPSETSSLLTASFAPVTDSVYIVEADTASISDWDDEHGIVTMRKYYALRDEAHDTVSESKKVWEDTPFSIFAVQSFQPPRNKDGMKAILEHSKQTYGPLSSELRPHRVRSRTSSRASPYPLRSPRSAMSPERSRINISLGRPFASPGHRSVPLMEISIDPNINACSPPPPVIEIKPFTPFAIELDKSKEGKAALGHPPRQRVTSSTRRNALGWKKRNAKSTAAKSAAADKENTRQDMIITPSESLRLSRPRPKGRPTPARKPAPAI